MSPCDRTLLVRRADGDLPEGEGSSLDAHLGVCDACAREAEQIGRARRALRATATCPIPSNQAWFRVRHGVASRRRRRLLVRAAGVALAGAVAAGLLAGALRALS
jgi:anti-sigma factor RsiW